MKTTVLNEQHRANGAICRDYDGWDMPQSYGSASSEHMAALTTVGIFDLGNLSTFWIRGSDAFRFLDFICAASLAKLEGNFGIYSAILDDSGSVIDVVWLAKNSDREYLLVANPAAADRLEQHLRQRVGDYSVDDIFASDFFSPIAVIGPKSVRMLQKLTATELEGFARGQTAMVKLLGKWGRISKTSFCKAEGFEIFLAPDEVQTVWDSLLGQRATPCGMEAKNSLRLESNIPNPQRDLGPDINILQTPFARFLDMEKDFCGKDVLQRIAQTKELLMVQLEQGEAKGGEKVFSGGVEVGQITSAAHSPIVDGCLAFAWVETNMDALEVGLEGGNVPVRVVQPSH